MKIEEMSVKVGDIADGYQPGHDVSCMGGTLMLGGFDHGKYAFQQDDRDNLIRSVTRGFPIGMLHFYEKPDRSIHVVDGRARLKAILDYVSGGFAVDGKEFDKLKKSDRDAVLSYELVCCVCSGEQQECFDWLNVLFKFGDPCSMDTCELHDLVFSSPWRDDARRRLTELVRENPDYFDDGANVVDLAVAWAANREDVTVDEYLADNDKGASADVIVRYMSNVIHWVKGTFTELRPDIMKGQPWGEYFNDYGNKIYKPEKVDGIIRALIEHPDVQNKKGIYEYILCGDDESLDLKKFGKKDLQAVLDAQGGKCAKCGCDLGSRDAKLVMIQDFKAGGRVEASNAMALCRKCVKAGK